MPAKYKNLYINIIIIVTMNDSVLAPITSVQVNLDDAPQLIARGLDTTDLVSV